MSELTLEQQKQNLERLLDIIADTLINDDNIDSSAVMANQKFINNGQLEVGAGAGVLAIFQKDIKANQEDLNSTQTLDTGEIISELQSIANTADLDYNDLISLSFGTQGDYTTVSVKLQDTGYYIDGLPITSLIFSDGNPLNLSQFISLEKSKSVIDVEKANEYLDTNIYELLPIGDTRQERIIRFFNELNALLPPPPSISTPVERDNPHLDWVGAEQYSRENSISYTQENEDGVEEEDAFIHRLKSNSLNNPNSLAKPNDTNESLTIEDIYRTIEPYLTDILEEPIPPEDGRQLYRNKSTGYLQFRDLNQGIIIRNTDADFIESLDPNNPTWLTSNYDESIFRDVNPSLIENIQDGGARDYILDNNGTGFTITMWVRFLDKTSSGTLFNYGNPTRKENPFGFKLETYVVNKEDPISHSQHDNFGEFVNNNGYLSSTLGLFQKTNSERFVRLQVREFGNATDKYTDYGLRDSHIGNPTMRKFSWNAPEFQDESYGSDDLRLLSTTHIPQNFDEWYFICASYNPSIFEPDETEVPYDNNIGDDTNPLILKHDPMFWMNHRNPDTGELVVNSGFGNKCKVEIISRTDLLRARGFRVE